MNGLDHEYETVVNIITYQMDEIDLEKVQYLLLMHEQRFASKNMPQSSLNFESVMTAPMHVNMTSYMPLNGNSRGSFVKRGGGYMNREGKRLG